MKTYPEPRILLDKPQAGILLLLVNSALTDPAFEKAVTIATIADLTRIQHRLRMLIGEL